MDVVIFPRELDGAAGCRKIVAFADEEDGSPLHSVDQICCRFALGNANENDLASPKTLELHSASETHAAITDGLSEQGIIER
jgi:hypothetical protein